MPQLENNSSPGGVDAVCHAFPARDLVLRPNTRSIRITDTHRRDRGRFRNNQTGAGPLLVVLAHQIVWYSSLTGSTASEGRHDDAIGQFPVADANWVF